MAQFNFFDYGRSQRDANAIRSGRLQNRAAGMEIEQQENALANRAKAREIRQQVERTPDQIAALERDGLFDQAAQLRESYVAQKYNAVKMIGTMRDSIDESNYKQFRQDMIQSGAVDPTMMPTEYSDEWFRNKEAEERGKLETETRQWADQGHVMSQDFVQQDGRIVWEGEPYEAAADRRARQGGQGEPFEMKASDSNSIRAATASLYDSIWDPQTGRYSGLNKEQSREVASVAEEASRIFRTNRENGINISHAEAVSRAARKMEPPIQIRDLERDPGNQDPLRLFDGGPRGAGGRQQRQPGQGGQGRAVPQSMQRGQGQQRQRPRGPQYGPTTRRQTPPNPDEIPTPRGY